MRQKLLAVLLAAVLVGTMAGCAANQDEKSVQKDAGNQEPDGAVNDSDDDKGSGDSKKITVVLDFTPNTNHT